MIDGLLEEIRRADGLNNAIINSVVLDTSANAVTVKIITDKIYSGKDCKTAEAAVRKRVPEAFACKVEISKLTPDCAMVAEKVLEAVRENFKALFVTLDKDDIDVKRCEDGFSYTVKVMPTFASTDICTTVNGYLSKYYCGNFYGSTALGGKNAMDLVTEERQENIEYEIPIRKFEIEDFAFIEGTEKQENAVYLSDMNFESEKVVVCGRIEDITERTYTNSKNQEKIYYNFTLNDNTAYFRVTYFTRLKSIDKIRALKVGDSIVCTGKAELFKGFIRFTANTIDYGRIPEGFIPKKRESKPVPKYYVHVRPQPYSDIAQTDMFADVSVPECLKGKSFVVFDLETTGLNSSPSSGNMDKIIEIGAFKINDGVICESFSTFINPQRKLSEEIVKLTGISQSMVDGEPTEEQVMPDFYKFCDGSILVGHNIAGFDFKFVEYYCAKCGYMLERRLIDTIPLSQELLFLSNYKLNTVADKFGISFNHHRAVDDALVTAKIFIELIKIKKSLPNMQ